MKKKSEEKIKEENLKYFKVTTTDIPENLFTSDTKDAGNRYLILGTKGCFNELRYLTGKEDAYKRDVAYYCQDDDYVYTYMGAVIRIADQKLEPGIYLDQLNKKYFRVSYDPNNAEYDQYKIGKIKCANPDPENIFKDLKENGDAMRQARIETEQFAVPAVTPLDDILKRIMKMTMRAKNLTFDQIRYCFPDKNQVFNFKQIINGEHKLSMMIFIRTLEALNLKCVITIEEINPDKSVGKALEKPITVSSEDTFEA